jgi:hypothetical protein
VNVGPAQGNDKSSAQVTLGPEAFSTKIFPQPPAHKRVTLKLKILVRRGHAGIADKHDSVPATQPEGQAWERKL